MIPKTVYIEPGHMRIRRLACEPAKRVFVQICESDAYHEPGESIDPKQDDSTSVVFTLAIDDARQAESIAKAFESAAQRLREMNKEA